MLNGPPNPHLPESARWMRGLGTLVELLGSWILQMFAPKKTSCCHQGSNPIQLYFNGHWEVAGLLWAWHFELGILKLDNCNQWHICKPARQTTESIQIYQNIPGSKLPRLSCQILHVGAKNIQIYGQTNPDTNIMNLIQKLFSEFLKLEKESRSERHQQIMTIHYPNISVKPVKQCHDNRT